MATVVRSFAIQGIDGYPVDIEIKMLEGQPSISIIGLGDQAVKEAAERIQAAIDESGYVFPKKRVIISLAPSDKKKSGSHFDLAMAVGVLCQNGDIGVKKLPDYGFIGELSLDGRLRACRGILPMIIAGQKRGIKKIIVPEANFKEASLVHGVEILGFYDLTGVIRYLEGKTTGIETHMEENEKILEESERILDFKDVKGQDELIEAVVLAAAGGHNMLMVGEPGCGKTMIAQRIPTILPEMTEEECLEVTKIYSISGLLPNGHALMKYRPFRAPHHTGQRRLARNLLRDVVGNYIGSRRESLEALAEMEKTAVLMKFELQCGNIDGFAELLNTHWELSKQLDKGSTNTCIDQIFVSIEDLIDGRFISGAGGGGFLQVIMKKGVTRQMLSRRLHEVFQDSGVDVWETRFI